LVYGKSFCWDSAGYCCSSSSSAGLSIVVLQRYSDALAKFLSENYRSVEYGQAMKDELERLGAADDRVERGDTTMAAEAARARGAFVKNLQDESNNVTLHPREDQLVAELRDAWAKYETARAIAIDAARTPVDRKTARETASALSAQIRQRAQEIININLNNMVVEDVKSDGRPRQRDTR